MAMHSENVSCPISCSQERCDQNGEHISSSGGQSKTALETPSSLKTVSLVLLTCQGTIMPLLVRYSRIRETEEMFLATSSVFLNEIIKFIVCVGILLTEERSLKKFFTSLHEAIILQPFETLKVCVPSLIYAIQNNLYFVALSNLDASTYLITYQLKILTTALFFVIILRKPLSAFQWASLVILMIGVSMVQLQDQIRGASAAPPHVAKPKLPGMEDEHKQNKLMGFVAVLLMCLSSGFAGVYFEKVLKGSSLSVWMQNVRLALLGIPLTGITMLVKDWSAVFDDGILRGYDWLVWTITFFNSAGGLIIAVVMKYADNILKAYAQSLAIILACVGSGFMFNFVPTVSFVTGTCLVIFSIFLYARFPYKISERILVKTDQQRRAEEERVQKNGGFGEWEGLLEDEQMKIMIRPRESDKA